MWFHIFPPSSIVPKELLRKVRKGGRIGAVKTRKHALGWGTRRKPTKDSIWLEQAKGLVWVLTVHLQTQSSKTVKKVNPLFGINVYGCI